MFKFPIRIEKVGKTYCGKVDSRLFSEVGSVTVGEGSYYINPDAKELFIDEYVSPEISARLSIGLVVTKMEDLNCYFPEGKKNFSNLQSHTFF